MASPIKASAHDIDVAARTVWGEARGDSPASRLGVAWVIRNRAVAAAAYKAAHGKPHPLFGDGSLAAVCVAPLQFSCRNPNDPNAAKLASVTLDDIYLQLSLSSVLDAVLGAADDPTQGAVNYYADSIDAPSWAAGKPFVSLGHHRFLTEA